MNSVTKRRRQRAGVDIGSPSLSPKSTEPSPQERSVVILGVMYPCSIAHPDEVFQDAASDRQGLDLIFYDPIPSIWK
jgi:hypothetical protein